MSPKKQQKRQEVLNFFRQTAVQENQKNQKINFEDLLGRNDKKRVLLVQPESAGDVFLITSLFRSIRERYPRPEWTFYVSTKKEYKEILDGNPYLDKWIEYQPIFDNLIWLEGKNDHNGYFDVAYLPYLGTQKLLDYMHHGIDKIAFDISYEEEQKVPEMPV